MLSPSDDLKAMIEAAKAAGDGLERHFGRLADLAIRSKAGPSDMVSIADEEAEQTTRSILARARPSYAFLGEEGGAVGGTDDAQCWIVDPLDGTTNFLFACPLWGVNVALAREGKVVAGLTYIPVLNEFYVAEEGKGAWLNGQRIHVSRRDRLDECLLGCGIPFAGKPDHPVFAREMALLTSHVAGIRRTGSAAVDLAWTAAGRWDAYWERCTSAWDMAPGAILVTEAGGRVSQVTGASFDVHKGNVCVTNGLIHDRLIGHLNQALAETPA